MLDTEIHINGKFHAIRVKFVPSLMRQQEEPEYSAHS